MENQTATETLELDNALVRALFFAWKLPNLHRHEAVLDVPGLDPVVAAAGQAIQGGNRTLAAVTDPAVIDLLSIVDALPMPSKLAMRYAEGRGDEETAGDVGGKLARELLGSEAALAWPEVTPGGGEWPTYPRHTCGAETATGTAITFRPHELEAVRIYTPKWHDCDACYHARVKRYSSQLLFELSRLHEDGRGLICFELRDKGAHVAFAAKVRQQRKRNGIEGGYIAFPQEDGRFYVVAHSDIANLEGQVIPYTKPAIYSLVHGWAKTPEGRRVSPSDGWGGPWQGSKGDGRKAFARKQGEDVRPNKQLWTKSSLEDVAAALAHELRPHADSLLIQIDPLEAYQKLTAAGIELHDRKTNRGGLSAVLDLVGVEDVTHKGHSEDPEEEEVSLMRDIQHQTTPPAAITEAQICFDLVFGGDKWNYR